MTEHDFLDKVKTRGYYKSFTVDLTYQAIRQNGKLFKKQAMVEGANDIESLVTHFATHKPQIVNHKKFTFDGIINAVVRHNFRGLWWRGGEREPFTSAEVRHFKKLIFPDISTYEREPCERCKSYHFNTYKKECNLAKNHNAITHLIQTKCLRCENVVGHLIDELKLGKQGYNLEFFEERKEIVYNKVIIGEEVLYEAYPELEIS